MGCADSLESQEFPIIIPLPFQQPGGREHKNRTPGPSLQPEAEALGMGLPQHMVPGKALCQSWYQGAHDPKKALVQDTKESLGSYLLQLSANQGLELTDPRLAGPPPW